MIDATYFKAHRTASSLEVKRGFRAPDRTDKGRHEHEVTPLTDENSRPFSFFITAGQISDYNDTAALLDNLPKDNWMLADPGYDAAWFRDTLKEKGIKPCIRGCTSRWFVKYNKRRYKRHNRVEIIFGRLKDRRRVAMRYDRCPNRLLLPSRTGRHCALLAMIVKAVQQFHC